MAAQERLDAVGVLGSHLHGVGVHAHRHRAELDELRPLDDRGELVDVRDRLHLALRRLASLEDVEPDRTARHEAALDHVVDHVVELRHALRGEDGVAGQHATVGHLLLLDLVHAAQRRTVVGDVVPVQERLLPLLEVVEVPAADLHDVAEEAHRVLRRHDVAVGALALVLRLVLHRPAMRDAFADPHLAEVFRVDVQGAQVVERELAGLQLGLGFLELAHHSGCAYSAAKNRQRQLTTSAAFTACGS